MKLKVKEKDVQRAVIDYLKLRKLMVIRINSGSFTVRRKDGSAGFVRGAEAGTADILAFSPPSVIWVECKSSVGKLTESQEAFREKVESLGHIYIVARGIEDVECLFTARR